MQACIAPDFLAAAEISCRVNLRGYKPQNIFAAADHTGGHLCCSIAAISRGAQRYPKQEIWESDVVNSTSTLSAFEIVRHKRRLRVLLCLQTWEKFDNVACWHRNSRGGFEFKEGIGNMHGTAALTQKCDLRPSNSFGSCRRQQSLLRAPTRIEKRIEQPDVQCQAFPLVPLASLAYAAGAFK